MRTTVTLDPDVEKLLREAQVQNRVSFKQALNDAIRRGLKATEDPDEEAFKVNARALGLRSGIDSSRIQELDDEIEVDEFLRKTRALEEELK